MPQFQDLPLELRLRIFDYARAEYFLPLCDPLHLASQEVRAQTEALERYAISVTEWYMDPNHFELDFVPHNTNFLCETDPSVCTNVHIPGWIGFRTQLYNYRPFLTRAIDTLASKVERLVLRPMPRPYDVIVTLEFDSSAHPTVRFDFLSEEDDDDESGWEGYPEKDWREKLVFGMDNWRAKAPSARCEMWYIRMFIGVVKMHLPKDLPWSTGVGFVAEEDRFKDW